MRIRLLPIIIILCVALFGLRVFEALTGEQTVSEILFAKNIAAADAEEQEEEIPEDESNDEGGEEENSDGEEEAEDAEEDLPEEAVNLQKDLTFTETEVEILKRFNKEEKNLINGKKS